MVWALLTTLPRQTSFGLRFMPYPASRGDSARVRRRHVAELPVLRDRSVPQSRPQTWARDDFRRQSVSRSFVTPRERDPALYVVETARSSRPTHRENFACNSKDPKHPFPLIAHPVPCP